MNPLVAIVIGVALGVLVLVLLARSRRSRDGVDSFRRQIDALSPEARRPVIDQVQNAASRIEPRPIDEPTDDGAAAGEAEPSDGEPDPPSGEDDPSEGEDEPRGA